MYNLLRARKLNGDGYLDSFGDPKTLSCDRDSQGDVIFADMSYSVSRSRALDDIENGILPQKWMGQFIIHMAVILMRNGRLIPLNGG